MSGNSVGAIALDLNLNTKQFNTQLTGITRMAKKAGAVIASAFAVKALVNFGRECVKLGSDLTEVQNVVDVTFGSMSENVNAFARDAIQSYGISETLAKKYMGTYGAMSKAFNYSTAQAYEMSAALTGLTGDVASFYNLSTGEAYTKLKSVFTGETESLKELGVVMTQNALDAYAMANGYGKVTARMSEQEKVALRLAFVQDKLALASGDFARTSGSWANQVRVLTLQFEQFRATIGQGLINVFTPVIQVINTLLAKLMTLANAFRSFTAMVFGDRSGGGSIGGSVAETAESMGGLAQSVGDVGSATAGAAKEIKKSLAHFDELNVLSDTSSSGSGGGSGAGGAAGGGLDVSALDTGSTVLTEANTQLDGVLARMRELAELFKSGFQIGLGDTDFSELTRMADGVRQQLGEIFNASDLRRSAHRAVDTLALALGEVSGSVVSVGATIGQNLVGGLERFLTGRRDAIKGLLVSFFDVSTEVNDLTGRLAVVVADIFSVFGGDNAQRVTAALYQMFVEPFAHIIILAGKFGSDLLGCIVRPLEENAGQIKATVDGVLGVIASVFEDLAGTVSYAFSTMQTMYDRHVAPMLFSFSTGVSNLAGVFLEAWGTHIQPVLESLAEKFREVVEGRVKPMIDSLIGFLGSVCDAIKALWETWVQPLAAFIIDTVAPGVGGALGLMGEAFNGFLTTASEVLGGLFDALHGLMNFITGVLTQDWSLAWNGLGAIVGGVFDGLVGLIKAPLNLVIGLVNKMLSGVESGINGIIRKINSLSFNVPDWVPGMGGKTFGFNLKTLSIPRIPALAEGGYIAANTPRLAMIGDNRTQGEIVAPEGKLAELLKAAVDSSGGGQVAVLLTAILELLRQLADNRDIVLHFDGDLSQLARLLKPYLDERDRLQGVRLVTGGSY